MQKKDNQYTVYKFIGSNIEYALLTKNNIDYLAQFMLENGMKKLLIKSGKIGWNESYLPDLSDFSFIEELRIHWTNIKDISGIDKCLEIQVLNIDNDDKTNIDFKIFNRLKKLVVWDRPGCETLWELKSLEELTVAGLKQSHLFQGVAMKSMRKLKVFKSPISDLSQLKEADNLYYLELDTMSNLENINWLRYLTQLKHLLINANKIVDFSVIENLINLEYCSLNSKKGELYVSNFTNLRRLKLLNISGNEKLRLLNRELDKILGLNRFEIK